MVIEIIIETICKCGRSIRVIATEYRCLNQDWSLHSCKPKDKEGIEVWSASDPLTVATRYHERMMADSEHLTYRDCSEYILCTAGDECFSRCKFTGTYCVADEAGLECSMWEEEKAEILKEVDVLPDTSFESS